MGNKSLSHQFFNLIQLVWRPVFNLMDAIVPQDEKTCRIIEALGLALIAAAIGGPVTTSQPAMAAGVADAFKHNRARKNVIVACGLIIVCVTLLSCISSFMIYKEGFSDFPPFVQWALALFCVIVVEGTFVTMVYGFTRAFSSMIERLGSLATIVFLIAVMLTNIITHFMQVKRMPLSPFQEAWLSWGAISIAIAVLVFVLVITLADPVSRLIRLELRVEGKQQETILHAKEESISSDRIQLAMIERADLEAEELAERIITKPQRISPGVARRLQMDAQTANYDAAPRRKK